VADDVERRVQDIERKLDNGRYLRRETFELVTTELRGDFSRIETDLGAIRAMLESERKDRENDRRGIRNLVISALLAAGASVVVSLIVASGTPT